MKTILVSLLMVLSLTAKAQDAADPEMSVIQKIMENCQFALFR
jgi:hypothetical protein